MSVRKGLVLLLAVSTLSFLVACGGSSGTVTNPVAPPTGGFSASALNGTYVFSISGADSNGGAFAAVGAFIADGSGNITGGTIDMNGTSFSPALPNIPINNNSFYKVSIDGRGTATLGLPTADSPFGGNITLDFVLQDSSHGLVMELDNTGVSGSGTLDLQAGAFTPTGSYAYSLAGVAFSGGSIATVGNFTLSGASFAGLEDFNQGGLVSYPGVVTSGSLTVGPSSTPATSITGQFGTQIYDVYAIDSTHLKFIEIDSFATMSGDAYSQTSPAIPVGPMAFTISGIYPANTDFAAGGFIVTDAANNISATSTEDYNSGGATLSPNALGFSGTYAVGGTGRYTLGTFTGFVGGTTYAAYPSSGGVLLLEIDSSGPVLGITLGAAYPQTAGAAFAQSQGYGLNLTGSNTTNGVEVDDIAEFTANSTGTITGLLDENYAPNSTGPIAGLPFTTTGSSYGSIDSSGRYGLSSAIGSSNATTLEGGLNLIFYAVDGTTFPFIESDSGQVSTGVIVLQSTPGGTSALAKSHSMFVPRPLIHPHSKQQKNR